MFLVRFYKNFLILFFSGGPGGGSFFFVGSSPTLATTQTNNLMKLSYFFNCYAFKGHPGYWPLKVKKTTITQYFFQAFLFKYILLRPNKLPETLGTTPENTYFYRTIHAFEMRTGGEQSFLNYTVGIVAKNTLGRSSKYSNNDVQYCRLPLIAITSDKKSEIYQYYVIDTSYTTAVIAGSLVLVASTAELLRPYLAYGQKWFVSDIKVQKTVSYEPRGFVQLPLGSPFASLQTITGVLNATGFSKVEESACVHISPMEYSEFISSGIFDLDGKYATLFSRCKLETLTNFELMVAASIHEVIVALEFDPTVTITDKITADLENHTIDFLATLGLLDRPLIEEFCREMKHDKVLVASKSDTLQVSAQRISHCHEIIRRHVSSFNDTVIKNDGRSSYTRSFLKHRGRQEQTVSGDIFGVVFAGLYPIRPKKQ